jgi:hypothetical protein
MRFRRQGAQSLPGREPLPERRGGYQSGKQFGFADFNLEYAVSSWLHIFK